MTPKINPARRRDIATVFPFSGLQAVQLGDEFTYGTSSKHMDRNYLRSLIIRKLRLENSKNPMRWVATAVVPKDSVYMLDLPLDIIFQIFSRLHPLDLYHLCFTCKTYRQFLLGRDPQSASDAQGLWKQSFVDNHVPLGPASWEIPRWAFFLFGPPICKNCGGLGAQVNFGRMEKYCDQCAPTLKSDDEVISLCRKHEHGKLKYGKVDELCPNASRRPLYSQNARKLSRAVHSDDVEWAISFMCEVCHERRGGNLQQVWEKNREDKRQSTATAEQASNLVDNWIDRIYGEHRTFQIGWYRERCKKELQKLGYTDKEMNLSEARFDAYFDHWFSNEDRGLAQRDLKYHLSHLVRIAKRGRDERYARTASAYKAHLKHVKPCEWRHTPSTLDPDSELFKDLADIVELPGIYFSPGARLSEWRRSACEGLLSQLPQDFTTQNGIEGKSPLDLAVAVFSCEQCLNRHISGVAISGQDDILAHMCLEGYLSITSGYKGHSEMVWSEIGHVTVLALLKCLGLDPQTTTAEDLDSLDPRFFCGRCEIKREHGTVTSRKALRWRECLSHATYAERHPDPKWILLSGDAASHVKSREKEYPAPWRSTWGCAHCREHIDVRAQYSEVAAHVLNEHRILDPERGRDIIYLTGRIGPRATPGYYKARQPILYQTDPGWTHRCLRCPPIPIDKLWTEAAVFKHLHKRHHLPEFVEGRDWERIQIHQLEGSERA